MINSVSIRLSTVVLLSFTFTELVDVDVDRDWLVKYIPHSFICAYNFQIKDLSLRCKHCELKHPFQCRNISFLN